MRRVCGCAGKVGRRERDGSALSPAGRFMVGRLGGGRVRRERRREGVQVREAGFGGVNSRKSMFDFWV